MILLTLLSACKKEHEKPVLNADIEGAGIIVKAGNTVTFNEVSTGNASRWKWSFPGGSPETSELSSPTVQYDEPGVYDVTLEIKNAYETKTIVKKGFVTVQYNEISADFSADKLIILEDESISFTDLSTGMPNAWSWEFIHETDGVLKTSTVQHPTITFDVAGKYSVKLRSANPEYNDEELKELYIEVIDPRVVSADFTANAFATYTGGSISFTETSIGYVESRTWTFEGGNPATSTSENPTVTYNSPGRYKVKLVATNAFTSSEKEYEEYIVVVPGQNLKAFLPFNSEVKEVGPLAIPLTVQGTVDFTGVDRKGKTGHAASFSGSQGVYLESANVLNLGTGNFSVSCWVKTSSTSRMTLWQESGRNGTGDNQSWLRMNDNATDRQLRFNTEESGGSSILNIGAEGKLNDNSWKHVVAVRNGTNMSVYINGVKVKELNTPAVRNVTGNQAFKIAFQEGATSFSNFYTGMLDEFLIYDKALTVAEITALYNL
mgnify:CR=1 FL=1